jgi:hypothetical protein
MNSHRVLRRYLYYEYRNNKKFCYHCINKYYFLYVLTKTCAIDMYVFLKLFIALRFNDILCKLREVGDYTET